MFWLKSELAHRKLHKTCLLCHIAVCLALTQIRCKAGVGAVIKDIQDGSCQRTSLPWHTYHCVLLMRYVFVVAHLLISALAGN